MNNLYLLYLIFLVSTCNGQKTKQSKFTYENFNSEILNYEPKRKSGVSEKDFNSGVFKLNETKKAVNNDPENFTYADYWNISMAFVNLDETSESIEIAFKKATELDPENICKVIKGFGNSGLDIKIPETFYAFLKVCSNQKLVSEIDLESYAKKNGLDIELVALIYNIHTADIKYRSDKPVDWAKQRPLDKRNQELIDSLFTQYQVYIGRSLVGKKFETTMWAIVQHGNTEMMEKYLPVIQQATQHEELSVVPFKMLIDRYYGLKYGYQVFGSQSGFGLEMADDKTRKEIALKYGIE